MPKKQKQLLVGVQSYKPLVYQDGERWTGLEIELWEQVANSLGVKFTYVEKPDFSELLVDTISGKLDISMAGITRTTLRAEDLGMSYFTLDTGLGIATVPNSSFSVKELLKSLFSKQTKTLLLLLMIFSVIVAHLYWVIEGGHSVTAAYSEGILESIWWSIVTFSTVGYGDIFPITGLGKAFGIVAILSGLAIFGLYIGQISASLALVKIESKINSPSDLAGKKVAVKRDTTAASTVAKLGGHISEFNTVEETYEAVIKGEAVAVVADMPVLQDSTKEYNLVIAGPAFSRQAYSYIFPKGSSLTKKVNKELVRLREEGTYDQIYNKYLSHH